MLRQRPTPDGPIVLPLSFLDKSGVIHAAYIETEPWSEERTTALKRWLEHLGNDNAQGEYYLTDVFAAAADEYAAAEIVVVADPLETEGANDPWQLARLERAFQLRQVRVLCTDGARVADPARIDIRGTVRVGRDVEIDVDVVFEGDV